MTSEVNERITKALVNLDKDEAVELTTKALSDGADAASLISDALAPGMRAMGDLFEGGEAFLPELLVAAEIFKDTVELARPHLTNVAASKGRVVIGTVAGDIHDIGKNVVALYLEASGFEVRDLGKDVPAQRFARAAVDEGADIVAASAMLTSTERQLEHVVEAVRAAGSHAAVLVGGAPVTAGLATEYGADGTAPDAAGAVRVAESLLQRT